MQSWHTPYLGLHELLRDISSFELQTFFTYRGAERDLIEARRRNALKLGLALHIGFLRLSGRLLNSVRIVPSTLWHHLGQELGVTAPELASLRALYGRGRTLFDHQQLACEVLGFRWMTEYQRRALVRTLRDEVARCADRDQLLVFARRWLYQNKILILRDRDIRVLVTAALAQLEEETAKAITAAVPMELLSRWRSAMSALRPDGQTQQSWLWAAPVKHSTKLPRCSSESSFFMRSMSISIWIAFPILWCGVTHADWLRARPRLGPESRSRRVPWRWPAFCVTACSPPLTKPF